MEYEEYYNEIMKVVGHLPMFANKTYIKLLHEEEVPIQRAIDAIKRGNNISNCI